MKYVLFCLSFFFVFALTQDCLVLDAGSYTCSINHPGHGAHGATFVLEADTGVFSYESEEGSEDCAVSGDYTLIVNSLSFVSVDDIACIVDSEIALTLLLFSKIATSTAAATVSIANL